MTIARNIEEVPYNWNSFEVGKGWIYRGNSNKGGINLKEASTNDSGEYFKTF